MTSENCSGVYPKFVLIHVQYLLLAGDWFLLQMYCLCPPSSLGERKLSHYYTNKTSRSFVWSAHFGYIQCWMNPDDHSLFHSKNVGGFFFFISKNCMLHQWNVIYSSLQGGLQKQHYARCSTLSQKHGCDLTTRICSLTWAIWNATLLLYDSIWECSFS